MTVLRNADDPEATDVVQDAAMGTGEREERKHIAADAGPPARARGITFMALLVSLLLALTLTPATTASEVRLQGTHFANRDGSLFVPLGGLYGGWVPRVQDGVVLTEISGRFRDLGEAEWREWFRLLRQNGCTTVRVFADT